MRAARLLRSTEGEGAESHRVAKVAQGGSCEAAVAVRYRREAMKRR